MDSPEPTTANTTSAVAATAAGTSTTTAASATSLDSPQVQESPFSNFVSNLSPIKPVKAPPVVQGFQGLNSPPLVFTSPRIVSDREANSLPRFQCPRISGAELNKGNGDLGKPHTFLRSRLIPGLHKSCNVENSTEDQPGSSSVCVDEYLSDPAEAECANSVDLVNKNLRQSDDLPQLSVSFVTNREEHALKSDHKNELRIEGAPCQVFPDQAVEHFQGHSSSGIMPQKIGEKTGGDNQKAPCQVLPDSGLPVDPASEKKQSESSGTQTIGHYGEDVGAVISKHVQSATQHDAEASQLQRGMSRRCLQFEEAKSKTTSGDALSPNISSSAITGSKSPAFVTDFESSDPSPVNLTVSSSLKQKNAAISPHNSIKPPLTVSKPSGIGLHLNSIVSTLPVGHSVTASMKPVPTISFHVVNKNSGSQLSDVEEVSVTAENRIPEPKASLARSPVTSDTLLPMETLRMLPQFETQVTPQNKRKFDTELADNFEEFDRPIFSKKRRKSSTDVDGCKRCNCKKTKCLKLYCDCFAAGIYCADTCACQGCLNRPEYEDTVVETRESIESRNPIAFHPKIVQKITHNPAMNGDDGNMYTPSSARHKRGCNCKKSMCLKKYCECYQANVGCSSGCRCEGCKNVFGRKDEYGMTEQISSNRETREQLAGTADEHVEMVASSKCISHSKLCDLHNLTPSLEYPGYGNDAPKSRLVSRTYVPSPQSDVTSLTSYEKPTGSPRSPHGNDMLSGISKDSFDGFSFDQGIDYSIREMMDQLSPRCNMQSDVSDLTPLPNHPVMFASSASSKTRECSNVSRLPLCSGSGGNLSSGGLNISRLQLWPGSGGSLPSGGLNISRLQVCPGSGGSLSSGGSLRWRNSTLSSSTQVVGSKNLARDLDSTLYDIAEDDTPEILKEATPIASVKVSSPNKKRVSPPHSHIRQLGSSSSGAFKSGRKFILKAVPSFPPLSPCMDSKDSTNQK